MCSWRRARINDHLTHLSIFNQKAQLHKKQLPLSPVNNHLFFLPVLGSGVLLPGMIGGEEQLESGELGLQGGKLFGEGRRKGN
jgi:hypothetical protein